MSYDLFVSYSRRDNGQGRISRLVACIKAGFEAIAGRPFQAFMDSEIRPMDDWRLHILKRLRESRLLLACISPAYLQSEYCEWEFNEYLKREVVCSYSGEGIMPVYLEEVPGWEKSGYDTCCPRWVAQLRQRQQLDLRSWNCAGRHSPEDADGHAQVKPIGKEIHHRILRRERAALSPGNVMDWNPRFIGRDSGLKRLSEKFFAPAAIPGLTVISGLGGIGKTSLARAYAHRHAHEYGGGRSDVQPVYRRYIWFPVPAGRAPQRVLLAESYIMNRSQDSDDGSRLHCRQWQSSGNGFLLPRSFNERGRRC